MKKEVSIDLWRELFEVVCNIRSLEPWEYLWDVDLVGINLGDKLGIAYCSVMGHGGECYGIGTYLGLEGLCDFERIIDNEWHDVPPEQFMLEQDCLTCYWGDREDVPSEQKKAIKELGYKFRGRGNWPYFISYKKRYYPHTLDEAEVKFLIETYKNLFMVIRELHEDKLPKPEDGSRILWREYSAEQSEWHTRFVDRPEVDTSFKTLKISDLFLRKQLQKKSKIGVEMIVDLAYINASVKDDGYDRPLSVMVLLAINAADGSIITLSILKPEQNEQVALLQFFTEFVQNNGRMNAIITRNPKVVATLQDSCRYCKIPLLERDVEEMDLVIEMLSDSL